MQVFKRLRVTLLSYTELQFKDKVMKGNFSLCDSAVLLYKLLCCSSMYCLHMQCVSTLS